MLTKELLHFSVRKGRVHPRFIDPADPRLLGLAEALTATARDAVGEGQGALEEALVALTPGGKDKKLGDGLVKLVLDRVEVDAPDPAAQPRRLEAQRRASEVLATLPPDSPLAAYEQALDQAFQGELAGLRERLYADLPARRVVKEVKLDDASGLLHRYNLALAQSFLLYTEQVVVELHRPPLPELRRVLRQLRFCRLVAQIERVQDNLQMTIEGPGKVLGAGKRYGLLLAIFMGVLPILPKWRLTAQVTLPRRPTAELVLDASLGLLSPHRGGSGYVPEEIEATLHKLEGDETFEVETQPEPRPIGVSGLLVPDLAFVERSSGRRVLIELFHTWHQHALEQRIQGLGDRPDPELLLGVDRAVCRDPQAQARLQALPFVFLFSTFPGERVLKEAVKRHLALRTSTVAECV